MIGRFGESCVVVQLMEKWEFYSSSSSIFSNNTQTLSFHYCFFTVSLPFSLFYSLRYTIKSRKKMRKKKSETEK